MIYLCYGDSMPNFFKLSIVKTKKIPITDYKINDEIEIRGNNNKIYCHRIIKLTLLTVTTKGDNYKESQDYEIDLPITNILSKIIWRYPKN